MIRYSPSTGGFYDTRIHAAEQIPADAVEVSAQQHAALLDGTSAGKVIAMRDGAPTLGDAPPPSPEALAAEARATRARLIRESDWTALVDSALDADARAVWASYRQALRDVPQQASFPQVITWPTAPGA